MRDDFKSNNNEWLGRMIIPVLNGRGNRIKSGGNTQGFIYCSILSVEAKYGTIDYNYFPTKLVEANWLVKLGH